MRPDAASGVVSDEAAYGEVKKPWLREELEVEMPREWDLYHLGVRELKPSSVSAADATLESVVLDRISMTDHRSCRVVHSSSAADYGSVECGGATYRTTLGPGMDKISRFDDDSQARECGAHSVHNDNSKPQQDNLSSVSAPASAASAANSLPAAIALSCLRTSDLRLANRQDRVDAQLDEPLTEELTDGIFGRRCARHGSRVAAPPQTAWDHLG